MDNNTPFTVLNLATPNKRFTNFLIDTILCYLLTLALGELGIVLDAQYGFDAFVIGLPTLTNVKFSLANIMVSVVYYGLFESLLQRTPGKFVTGTKVIGRDGAKPSEGIIFLRTLLRQVPLEALTFLGPYAVGLHDSLSKTFVVSTKPAAIDPLSKDNTQQSTEQEDAPNS